MGKVYEAIDDRIKKWIGAQKVFFVSTAPLSGGRINCSPKDGYSIRVLDPKTLVYLDLIGSGVETIAHLKENGRIVIMMCAFEGAPMIMRFHGTGQVIEKDHSDFALYKSMFVSEIGIRSFIVIHLNRISDSCGFGVPVLEFKHHRKQLRTHCERNGEEKLNDYMLSHNLQSIDGLPGVAATTNSTKDGI
jgi:Pyridoxamine 5'-phosphate oxidase